jgi:hypothetical protein
LELKKIIGLDQCQIIDYLSDKGKTMSLLRESILSTAGMLPEGGLISPKEFLHLGSRPAIDQTLSRLTREGLLLRVGRGAYTRPLQGRFGTRSPATQAVLNAIGSTSGEVIVTNGATSANVLGLTTQVPVREVFLTSGPSRKLHLGQRTVELRHAKRWELALGNRPSGMAVRALAWLGPQFAHEGLQTLRSKLPDDEWTAMRAVRATLPSWLARAVSEVKPYERPVV